MAYDLGLAVRCSDILQDRNGFEEKKMFGGIGYLINGNMACGVLKENLIVRVGPSAHDEAMAHPDSVPFDFTGLSMAGWIMVTPDGLMEDADLETWVNAGLAFADTLPAK